MARKTQGEERLWREHNQRPLFPFWEFSERLSDK